MSMTLNLHFDVNGTITGNLDTAGGKNTVEKAALNILANTVTGTWSDCCTEPTTYRNHVFKHMHPGVNNKILQKKRNQEIFSILQTNKSEELNKLYKDIFNNIQPSLNI